MLKFPASLFIPGTPDAPGTKIPEKINSIHEGKFFSTIAIPADNGTICIGMAVFKYGKF